ncbi:tRNA pseudouridine(55) synthase TruB [Benzoatithermus flavus]|uniref:tRNA pseudouridine synthase B n=1 Tax=Benzoatithermus flavus TaxID=3108223 RepID=A0ABU8XWX3_9PROT
MARRKPTGRPINGWLVIDKAEGMTSTHVVNVVKRLTHAQKVGHGGTLDPLATGILPIAMGEATKTVAYVMDARKAYEFRLRFGEQRDTDDATGEVIAFSEARPTDEAIRATLPRFLGLIQQVPPRFAAVKVQGERAYDIARRGEVVELAAREVRIDELELVGRPDADHADFRMSCGKGAYVRAIARDLGLALGCYAHVAALRRTEVGAFSVENALSLDALARIVEDDTLPQVLVPVATALVGIPALAVTEPQAHRLRSGLAVRIAPALLGEVLQEPVTVRAMRAGELVALARLENMELSPVRVFQSSPMPIGNRE